MSNQEAATVTLMGKTSPDAEARVFITAGPADTGWSHTVKRDYWDLMIVGHDSSGEETEQVRPEVAIPGADTPDIKAGMDFSWVVSAPPPQP